EDGHYSLRNSEDLGIYCPKAFAGPAGLPAPLADRSIPIVLQRCAPSESVPPFCSRNIRFDTQPLVDQLRLWLSNRENSRVVLELAAELFYTEFPAFSLRQARLSGLRRRNAKAFVCRTLSGLGHVICLRLPHRSPWNHLPLVRNSANLKLNSAN